MANVQLDLGGLQESSEISSFTSVPGSNVITLTLADGVVLNVPEQPAAGGSLIVSADLVNPIIATWAANCTSVCPNQLQVETATLAGTITVAGDIKVTITAVGMTGSPKDVIVAVAASDTAALVAGKVRTALGLDVDVAAFFTIGGTGADVSLTAKTAAANDSTMNIATANHLATGLTPAASSGNTTAGVASVLQQETATIAGTVSGSGNATITVTAAGMTNSPKAVSVAVLNLDTASVVGGKVRTALAADVNVNAFFTVSGTGADVILTSRVAAANDATMNIASANGTSSGLTTVATSANTTGGVLGVLQQETATLAGTVTASGDAKITVTAAGMTNSPKVVNVLVANTDTASAVGGKVRTALAADADVAAFFTVSGAGASVILTSLAKAANDATMNIASANGLTIGLTDTASSTSTTVGRAAGVASVTAFA